MQSLTAKEKFVLQARYYQGHNTGHIAKEIDCTRQYVSKISQLACKKIRTGKYAKDLLSFLPEWSIRRAEKRVQDDFKELSEQERGLLI